MDDQDVLRDSFLLGHLTCGDHRSGQAGVQVGAVRRMFSVLYDRYIDGEGEEPPSERMAAHVTALLERWCDVTEGEEDASPWAAGPLIDAVRGPLFYSPMRWSMAEEASACAATAAQAMELVCFDVRQGRLGP
ncbi:hypothetical protein [Streptomyces sp. SCL15-6]|uniref:hypothetical protein n=1 Tax=Streptomyces sp. SCL15-6 TaxID=2967222 RepID=UPI002966144B|nr:hypothetical protein [Streptomyces sp. SCL15-6]